MCTTVVVGRNRSATGSVLIAHSEELGRNSAHKVEISKRRAPPAGEVFPLFSGGGLAQPAALAGYISTKIFDKRHYPGEHTSGVNEHGVAVANNMALMRGIPEARASDIVPLRGRGPPDGYLGQRRDTVVRPAALRSAHVPPGE